MDGDSKKPEWTPKEGGEEYVSRIVRTDRKKAAENVKAGVVRRRRLGIDEYVKGVLSGDRTVLARAITLVESNSRAHQEKAQQVLQKILPHTGESIRIGITGVPGVGKSTFIDALGVKLIERGAKLAVLAVDPSSSITRGSILGDKTRMDELARKSNCFIRPSPAGDTLGGVASKTRETMLLCEAAGFNVIFVETVGVGQSEVAVRSMVDFFLLLLIAGAGDELQGLKRGIMELADAILITKSDGDNKTRSETARSEYGRALHYLLPATTGWQTKAHTCSALTGEGIEAIWNVVLKFATTTKQSGIFAERREKQNLGWLDQMIEQQIKVSFVNDPRVKKALPELRSQVQKGELPATIAAQKLVSIFHEKD